MDGMEVGGMDPTLIVGPVRIFSLYLAIKACPVNSGFISDLDWVPLIIGNFGDFRLILEGRRWERKLDKIKEKIIG